MFRSAAMEHVGDVMRETAMARTWASFEDRVRDVASLIWGRRPSPENIGGVAIDAALHVDPQLSILIEITEKRDLGKVREDVAKIVTAQNALFAKRILARSFCVVDASTVTEGMVEAGLAASVKVLTIADFTKIFFDFPTYATARLQAPFGSAVNPITGEKDDTDYVPVRYRVDGSQFEIGTKEIAGHLQEGRHIVLLGEYGSGKSRCIRETFRHMCGQESADVLCKPFAIDLRDAWGLRRVIELVSRHLADLGLDALSSNAVRALNSGALALLLDGFDELGSQAWSNESARLKSIRSQALQGVKDIIKRTNGGVLIAGREHYFPSNEEMFQALGIDPSRVIVIRSKEEFSDEELQEFFDQRHIDVEIPTWLPRRPLICQTINNLPEADRDAMFDAGASETSFWDHFIRVLCIRDARIHVAFDPDTIYGVLLRLGRTTRSRSANVGPLNLSDMQRAFEDVVGQSPGEEASVMLQRLPSLGRLATDSDERQFTDMYILDGLRAKDVAEVALSSSETVREVTSATWRNGLDLLGQRILASDSRCSDSRLLALAETAATSVNRTLGADIIASLLLRREPELDFEGLQLADGHFVRIDFTGRKVKRLTLADCTFGSLTLPVEPLTSIRIESSLAERVYGATSAKGLPAWAAITVDAFDSAENTAGIRRIGLKPAQQILATTIRKTFFQKGAGRKEEALTRGFAKIGTPGLTGKVLNYLLREGVLERSKGQEGWLYIPVRKHSGRMQAILAELTTSQDEIWRTVSEFDS